MPSPSIVHVCEPAAGGAARHVSELAREQARRGARVEIVFGQQPADAWLLAELQSSNVTVRFVPMPRRPSVELARSSVALRRSYGDEGWIVHLHSTVAGFVGRLAFIGRRRVIFTPHSAPALSLPAGWRRSVALLYEAILSRASRSTTVCVSRLEQTVLRSSPIAIPNLVLIPNRLLVKVDYARKSLSSPPVIAFVGRLARQKNPSLFVESLRLLRRRGFRFRALIVGSGPLEGAIRRAVADYELTEIVTLVSGADARDLYSGIDVLVCTSRYEALPYIFLEAVEYGVPIVTTQVGGVEECVRHGFTGLVVSQDAPDMLADAVEWAAAPGRWDRLTCNARDLAAELRVRDTVTELERVYNQSV